MKNRIASLMFAALIFCSLLLQSCAERNNSAISEESSAASAAVTETADTASVEPETVSEYIEDDLEPADLGGYNFRIVSGESDKRAAGEYITYEELTGDVLNDSLYNSTISVEDRFNCDISIVYTTDGFSSFTRRAVNAGDDAADIALGHDIAGVELAQSGYFYNLLEVPHFNFEKPWWPENTVDTLSIKNKMYVASNYLSFCGLHYTRILVFNKDLMEEYGIEMPYQKVIDGKWTFDEMIKTVEDVKKDLNGDSKMTMEDDLFGYATGGETWYCMQDSVGLTPYINDGEGNKVFSIDIEKADKYIEMVNHLINDTGCYVEEGFFGVEPFRQGRALVANSSIEDIYNTYRSSDFKYGIIPNPKLDETQKDYISSCTDMFWGMITTAERNLDSVGTIIEALSCSNYNKVIPAYFEIVLSKKLADAPEDAAMLEIIKNTRTICFAHAFGAPFADIARVCARSNKNFSSLYAMQQKLADRTISRIMSVYEKLP